MGEPNDDGVAAPRLGDDHADGRWSVAFPRRWWYPVSPAAKLRGAPISVTLMDTPLAVYRDDRGVPHALSDRCPHRNAPLSSGRVHADGCIECPYHGWRFDATGHCAAVPGAMDGPAAAGPTRNVTTYPTIEHDGFVWVWGEPGGAPDRDPYTQPELAGRGAGKVVFTYDLDCTLHASLENALDVPHTAFLHSGVFRGGAPRELTAVRRELPDGLEVQYLGEPVGLGSLRAAQDSATTFDHWDRFILPSIAQVEYGVAGWLRIVNTILHLPMSPTRTRAWFVVRFWTRLPVAVVKPIVLARGIQILRQDASMLARQTDNIRRFGGERYTSTELDLMGNAIWRLLRRAERAEAGGALAGGAPDAADEPVERTVRFSV